MGLDSHVQDHLLGTYFGKVPGECKNMDNKMWITCDNSSGSFHYFGP